MTDEAKDTSTVIVEREMPHPPEKIWRALTQQHLLEDWLMKNDFSPTVGHRFTLRNTPQPDVTVVIDCEVVAADPHKTLAYSWEAFGLESVVTWTLTPTSNGTHLRMEQRGFRPDQRQAYHGARAAWRQFIGNLELVVEQLD